MINWYYLGISAGVVLSAMAFILFLMSWGASFNGDKAREKTLESMSLTCVAGSMLCLWLIQ